MSEIIFYMGDKMSIFGAKKKTTLKVEGMSCNHCTMKVAKALEGVEGVKKADVDLGKKEAEVTFSGEPVSSDVLIKAVDEAGYKAATD
jgi:copper ion binding protein